MFNLSNVPGYTEIKTQNAQYIIRRKKTLIYKVNFQLALPLMSQTVPQKAIHLKQADDL